jgi:hypothetical protein
MGGGGGPYERTGGTGEGAVCGTGWSVGRDVGVPVGVGLVV